MFETALHLLGAELDITSNVCVRNNLVFGDGKEDLVNAATLRSSKTTRKTESRNFRRHLDARVEFSRRQRGRFAGGFDRRGLRLRIAKTATSQLCGTRNK